MMSDCEQYGPNEDHQYDGGGEGLPPPPQYIPPPPPPPPYLDPGVMGFEPGIPYEPDTVYEAEQMSLPAPQHYPTLSLCATYPSNFSTQVSEVVPILL